MRHGDTLWTIGHSTRPWEDFVALLHEQAIACLVDVRRFAGSRRNPQYGPGEMAPALAAEGIAYRPMPAFGGRRKPDEDSPNGAWRVAAFRGYADYMASDEFAAARDWDQLVHIATDGETYGEELMALARAQRTALMCAEAVWWRCHRRLIADDFTARGWSVQHIMAPGKLQQHQLHPEARLHGDHLVYPPGGAAQEKLF